MLAGFGELTLEQKTSVVSTVAFVAVAALIAYATVRTLRTQKIIEKRMHLDEDDA